MTLPLYIRSRHSLLAAALALAACSAAPAIVTTVGGVACSVMSAILGPSGQFWGTACDSLVKAIADEIAADTTPAVAAARASSPMSCSKALLVPVPGFEAAAQVCPGLEAAAARGAAKAVAASKAAKR